MNKANKIGFKAKRVIRSYCQTINAEPEKVFPLLCPVREAEWLEGWKYNLIYSETGFAEEGCVFSTAYKGEENTIWIITKHDKDNHIVEFARFTPNSRTCVLTISVKSKGNNTSNVYITYNYTSISDEGNQFIDDFTETEFLDAVKFWEKSMNCFLEKGEKLKKIKNT
ncbi:MAG: hypothetical protein GXP56_05620 [Deltaproteobacteria bacterium]|nr:hypothetical protein [Deltaproteobacteria bacterium]